MTPHRYPGIGTSSEIFGIALNGNFGGDHAIVNLPLGIRLSSTYVPISQYLREMVLVLIHI